MGAQAPTGTSRSGGASGPGDLRFAAAPPPTPETNGQSTTKPTALALRAHSRTLAQATIFGSAALPGMDSGRYGDKPASVFAVKPPIETKPSLGERVVKLCA